MAFSISASVDDLTEDGMVAFGEAPRDLMAHVLFF